jgi:hypothetical protein
MARERRAPPEQHASISATSAGTLIRALALCDQRPTLATELRYEFSRRRQVTCCSLSLSLSLPLTLTLRLSLSLSLSRCLSLFLSLELPDPPSVNSHLTLPFPAPPRHSTALWSALLFATLSCHSSSHPILQQPLPSVFLTFASHILCHPFVSSRHSLSLCQSTHRLRRLARTLADINTSHLAAPASQLSRSLRLRRTGMRRTFHFPVLESHCGSIVASAPPQHAPCGFPLDNLMLCLVQRRTSALFTNAIPSGH